MLMLVSIPKNENLSMSHRHHSKSGVTYTNLLLGCDITPETPRRLVRVLDSEEELESYIFRRDGCS